ncbi:unnamed protein product, partial [Nesidiocoris tenuis]
MNIQKFDTLDKENYDTWRILMEALLEKTDGIQFVNGTKIRPVLPTGGDSAARDAVLADAEKWDSMDRK